MFKTIQQALAIQRKKTVFNVERMSQFLYGQEQYHHMRQKLDNGATISYDFNDFNHSRIHWMKKSYQQFPLLVNQFGDFKDQRNILYLVLACQHQLVGSVHLGMFITCIQIMGTDSQHQQYLEKCRRCEIFGCYAQTQMGHGSDVQNLQTTATYQQNNDTFVINTPTISATKFWPGELGLNATHALVFAQMIVKGKNHGVQSFIVPIRDENGQALPGIQVGDIGPKIGFLTKDNGYLILNNVVIPKRNMLRRFISVSKKGQIKRKGDPKISYATMMAIRQYISCQYPKIYSQAITIATRYSFFRQQFKNTANQQIQIIEYQLQQQKLIPRIAQYYGLTFAGNFLKKLCKKNLENIKQKQDFSLMAQTHSCLCMLKAFSSQTVYYGMEICRRACGGHGYSHYSGLPSIIFQYAPHLTHQGQNTILYLQVARYLMKSYKYYLTKKKNLGESVKYIDSFDYLMEKRCQVNISDYNNWTHENIRILLAQGVCYLISCVSQKLLSRQQGVSDRQAWNANAGIRLQQLAIAHTAYTVFKLFQQAVTAQKNQQIRYVAGKLCMLYGVNLIIGNASYIIEGEFIQNQHISSLKNLRQALLAGLRPHIIGLVDSFGLPEKLIRSHLAKGNPYENYLEMARKNHLNHGPGEQCGLIIKNGIQEALKPKL